MDPTILIGRLQSTIYAARRGQTNKTLAVLTLALLGAGEYLRRDLMWQEFPLGFYAAYAFSGLCLIWLVWRLWKLAAPPPEVADKPVPSAIKGLLPWVVGDGKLFARLGRRAEIESLLGLAQNEQVPIIVVRGESGSGKTSLLQAGLRYTLGVESCVYWEALPDNASAALLHAIRTRSPEIESLDSLPSLPGSRWVLILDQFEQLHADEPEHQPIFRLLERIAKEPAPHRLSAVVSFRREYAADWLDFEQESSFRAEQVPVNLLPRSVAGDVMATIASQAGFTLEQELVDSFLSSVAEPRGVSPLDLSVGLDSLADFARQRGQEQITMREYQLAGEAEGLLLVFVQQKLEEVPEALRAPLLKGMLLSLVDLANNQRVAAGDTAAVIAAKAEVPENQVRPWLVRLALPRVRLLEQTEADRYRLPHERLVPVLRRLSGTELASLDQKRLLFESEYTRWKQTSNRRYLLGGKDLVEVLANREDMVRGDDSAAKAEYLEACIGRRRVLRLLGAGAAVTAMGGGYGGYRIVDGSLQRRALASWQLPQNLFTKQHQINGLKLYKWINSLDWLRSRTLRDFSCSFTGDMAEFERLAGLTELGITESSSAGSRGGVLKLPHNLNALSLDGWSEDLLSGLEWPSELRSLELKLAIFGGGLSNNFRFPPSLTSLRLNFDNEQQKLSDLKFPPTLAHLSFDGLRQTQIESLADMEIPPTLTSLDLPLEVPELTKLLAIKMPQQISSLTLSLSGLDSFAHKEAIQWPRNLASLSLNSFSDLEGLRLPDTLTSLSLPFPVSSKALLTLPQGITSLSIDYSGVGERQIAHLKFPNNITSLSLRLGFLTMTKGDLSAIQWPANMTHLSLELGKVKNLGKLDQLKKLISLKLDIGPELLPEVAKVSLRDITTLWVGAENTGIPDLPTGFKFLGIRT